jgi:peptidoglycan/LPS O-acetylase OafA/YrhL
MRADTAPNWLRPSTSWREALRTAAIFFVAFAGLHVLMWAVSLTPFESAEVLQAAALGLGAGLLRRAAPPVKRLLRAVAPEQLRVTLSALGIAAVFFGLGVILSIGESGSPLEGWPVWLGLSLLMGFVLAVVGAAEKQTDDAREAR